MKLTRSLLALPLLALVLGGQGCIITTDDGDSILTVENRSDFTLYEIRLAYAGGPWGPDETGSDVLFPGEALEIFDIRCDVYDVLVVDEVGAECELLDLDLCFSDAVWVITNSTLSRCPIFATKEASDGGSLTVEPRLESTLEPAQEAAPDA